MATSNGLIAETASGGHVQSIRPAHCLSACPFVVNADASGSGAPTLRRIRGAGGHTRSVVLHSSSRIHGMRSNIRKIVLHFLLIFVQCKC